MGLFFLFLVPQKATDRLQSTYAQVFHWPLAAGNGLTRAAQTVARERPVSPEEYRALLTTCQQFRNESANLQAQLQDANRQFEMLTKLRAQAGLERMQTIPARIIRTGNDEFTIDRGQESGVVVGQAVLSLTGTRLNDQCVVGIVSDVSRHWAQVRLITCPKCPLTVSVGKLGVPKPMEGRGDGTASISLVPTKYTVKAGDAVYADRKPGFLDAPIIAGEVTQCRRDPGNPLMWEITVKSACDVADLLDVVVLKPATAP